MRNRILLSVMFFVVLAGSKSAYLPDSVTSWTGVNAAAHASQGIGSDLNESDFDQDGIRLPPDPDFVIDCDPPALTITQGQSGGSSCKLTSFDGFAGEVILACAGLPAGVQWGFQPAAVAMPPNGSAVSALLLSVDSDARPGTYTFQVTSTNADVIRAFYMRLTVEALIQEASFTIDCNSINAQAGAIAQSLCMVTSQNGFSRAVTLSCKGLPAGVTCAFQYNPVTPPANGQTGSTLIMRVSRQASAGAYTIVIQGITTEGSSPISVSNAVQLVIAH